MRQILLKITFKIDTYILNILHNLFLLVLKIKYCKRDTERFPELILPHDLSERQSGVWTARLCLELLIASWSFFSEGYMRTDTTVFAIALEKNKVLKNGRALEMFGGELCNSWVVPIKNLTGALTLLGSEVGTNTSVCSAWCCSLSSMPADSVKLQGNDELGKRE